MAADDERHKRLVDLERALTARGRDLAVFLVYDRPARLNERPSLSRTFFAQRCLSDEQLDTIVRAFRAIGAYVEVFDGDRPFLYALSNGLVERIGRPLSIVYNGIGFGITTGGYLPGRMALLPAVADSYGIVCANSGAYTCAFALHRYHSFVVLRALGIDAPAVWHYREAGGWMGPPAPAGTKVIVKNTYEAWSVGVDEESVFVVDDECERRVAAIARELGQPVTLQEFVSGREVCVPIVATPGPTVLPAVEVVLPRAPGNPDAVMTIDDNLTIGGVVYQAFEGPDELTETLERTSLAAFDILQAQALGRMDYRIDASGRPWLTDAAITPGLTLNGSAFASFAELGIGHETFLRVVVAASLATRGLLGVG